MVYTKRKSDHVNWAVGWKGDSRSEYPEQVFWCEGKGTEILQRQEWVASRDIGCIQILYERRLWKDPWGIYSGYLIIDKLANYNMKHIHLKSCMVHICNTSMCEAKVVVLYVWWWPRLHNKNWSYISTKRHIKKIHLQWIYLKSAFVLNI